MAFDKTQKATSSAARAVIAIRSAVITVLCIFVHALLFITIEILAICSPMAVGFVVMILLHRIFGGDAQFGKFNRIPFIAWLFAGGGIIASLATLAGIITTLRVTFANDVAGTSNNIDSLRTLADSVSRRVGVSHFRQIRLTQGSEAQTIYAGRDRILIIGLLTLRYLTVRELETVIAHECGHHHNGAMLANRAHYRAFMLYNGFCVALQQRFRILLQRRDSSVVRYLVGVAGFAMIPQAALFLLYDGSMRVIGYLLNNSEYEFYCDAVAARAYGGNILASALRKLTDLSIAQAYCRMDGREAPDWLAAVDQAYTRLRMFDPDERYSYDNNASGTHPPLAARIERLQAVSPAVDDESYLVDATQICVLWESRHRATDALRRSIPKECYRCGAINASSAVRCDCGSPLQSLETEDEDKPIIPTKPFGESRYRRAEMRRRSTPKECGKCGIINASSATRCDCGNPLSS